MNTQYNKWQEFKPKMALVPALIFWVASIAFFVAGLKFEKPLILLGKDITTALAFSLALAITAIQVLGNDDDNMSLPMLAGWYASYALGIGTNVNGLMGVFNIQTQWLAWVIALSLGTMIEVLPEKFLIQFLRSLKPKQKYQPQPVRKQQTYKPVNKPAWTPPKHPSQPVFRPVNYDTDELPPWAKLGEES